ncbi:MAG: tetratricopeptide (TPR) repeat protein [Akkermansiaceae bacterium]|jgi:tetratricopeptide (TPR) repeat protein
MKKLKAIMAVGLSLTCAGLADDTKKKEQSAAALYNSGVALLKKGKTEEAEATFQKALKLKPGHSPSRYQLSRIPELNARVKLLRRKALFKNTKLEKIHFSDATLAEALEALNELTLQATKKKFSPNFVIQDPKEKLATQTVTLKMHGVPLSAVLKYVLDNVGATARLDEHATVIRPSGK